MSDDQPGRQRPDYSADLSGTPEDTPDAPPPTRPAPDDEPAPAEPPAAAGPEVRRVRADDLRDDPGRPTPAPADRRRPALVGAGLLGVAALVGAFALGRATADDGPERFHPASVGADPGGPFGDHDGWGPGDDRHHRGPGPGADRPGPDGWGDHPWPDHPHRDHDPGDDGDDNDQGGTDDTGDDGDDTGGAGDQDSGTGDAGQ